MTEKDLNLETQDTNLESQESQEETQAQSKDAATQEVVNETQASETETAVEPVVEEAKETAEEPVVEEAKEIAEEPVVEEAEETVMEPVVEEAKETVMEPVVEEAKETAAEPGVEEATEATSEKELPYFLEASISAEDFDWDASGHELPYSDDEIKAMEIEYDATFHEIQNDEIIKGIVSGITASDVILDVNHKSDGLVSLSEFRDIDDLKVGDEVDIYVVEKENLDGQLVLSRRKAKLMRAWESIVKANAEDLILKGTVVSKTKGGLIVDVLGMETFLPGSQIDVKPILDYDAFVGKTMEFKVVKINEAIKNAVVSHKALIESDIEAQRVEIISKLEKGQVLEGTIKNITDFGAFIDLGGVDGLLYITDISWGRINHPNEVLEINQSINVVVLDFDDNKRRISLGLKQLQPHPWATLSEEIVEGSTVKGKIVNIEDYGAFLEISPGVEGLVHVSEVSWSNQPINSRDYFELNSEFEAKVVTLDKEERKMSLSIKQLSADPWQDIVQKFPVESRHTGVVKNITPYGVFVELDEGIGGMAHISDLSWTKRFNHPSEFTKLGENLEVVVLEIDQEGRKLSLGHKQIEEDPWDTFETVFPVGSIHQGTIVKKDNKGAIVALPYGLEAFAPNRFLKKEDNSSAALDEVLDFVITEFSRDDKRIIASHSSLIKRKIQNEEDQKSKVRKDQVKKTRTFVAGMGASNDKATLGDLDVLSQLKAKMVDTELKNREVAKKKLEDRMDKEEPKAAVEKPKAAVKKPKAATEKPKAEAKKATKVKSKHAKKKDDDLKIIEGVGPKIESVMKEAGISNWVDLAKADVDHLKQILSEAGSRYSMHDPTTWPKQAEMAVEGKFEELDQYQDALDGGRE